MTIEEIQAKVRLALGVHKIDPDELNRLNFHISAAYNFFTVVKGITQEVIELDTGIQLLSIYTNDVWRESGKFEFSPATEILFNFLMDETAGRNYADSIAP